MCSDKDFIVDKATKELRELFKLVGEVEDLKIRVGLYTLINKLQDRLLFIEKVL